MEEKRIGRRIDWNENFKIRTRRNASIKHEVIKLMIVLKILEKYKSNHYWIRIYTEYKVGDKICDIYFENIKTNEIICYEIQKNVTTQWIEETKKSYENYEVPFFKTDWTLVRENDLPDEIKSLESEIKKLII